ncbi:hypothetical protein C8R46DRAFT_1045261 [Mycena filopes]|nr:hypothetical protein C8R46DRAFT_1045261 [Mycena filopes]
MLSLEQSLCAPAATRLHTLVARGVYGSPNKATYTGYESEVIVKGDATEGTSPTDWSGLDLEALLVYSQSFNPQETGSDPLKRRAPTGKRKDLQGRWQVYSEFQPPGDEIRSFEEARANEKKGKTFGGKKNDKWFRTRCFPYLSRLLKSNEIYSKVQCND